MTREVDELWQRGATLIRSDRAGRCDPWPGSAGHGGPS
jgi:hypothetical protein